MLEVKVRVEPCAAARAQIDAHGSERFKSLSTLTGDKGKCVWCAKTLVGRQRRWCSKECVNSAWLHCLPQTPESKMHRLILVQNWACAACGTSFEDELRDKIRKKYEAENRVGATLWVGGTYRKRTADDPPEKITFHRLGYCTGDRWQTDHIVPIHKGGKGIDPSNLQTICTSCHRRKTADERRVYVEEERQG